MASIWKYHADRLRKAVKEYMEAVNAYAGAMTSPTASYESKVEAAMQLGEKGRDVDVALTLCDAQDAVDAAGKGSAK